jgi:hypothetical protein
MKLLVLYRAHSEHGRIVEEFVRDFTYRHEAEANQLEVQDVDTRDGSATASLYDVVQYPAVLVLGDDGSFIKSWTGENLPLMDEVAGYLQAS